VLQEIIPTVGGHCNLGNDALSSRWRQSKVVATVRANPRRCIMLLAISFLRVRDTLLTSALMTTDVEQTGTQDLLI
jgi:hypothetical protein